IHRQMLLINPTVTTRRTQLDIRMRVSISIHELHPHMQLMPTTQQPVTLVEIGVNPLQRGVLRLRDLTLADLPGTLGVIHRVHPHRHLSHPPVAYRLHPPHIKPDPPRHRRQHPTRAAGLDVHRLTDHGLHERLVPQPRPLRRHQPLPERQRREPVRRHLLTHRPILPIRPHHPPPPAARLPPRTPNPHPHPPPAAASPPPPPNPPATPHHRPHHHPAAPEPPPPPATAKSATTPRRRHPTPTHNH